MWPEIIKENNIGIKLKNEFWNEWGPTMRLSISGIHSVF